MRKGDGNNDDNTKSFRLYPYGPSPARGMDDVSMRPPARPRLPLPAPQLPAPGPGGPLVPGKPGIITAPPINQLPNGPFNPMTATPWDSHVYPELPPVPEVPLSVKAEWWLTSKLRKAVDDRKRKKLPPGDDDRRKLPGPPRKRLPGANIMLGREPATHALSMVTPREEPYLQFVEQNGLVVSADQFKTDKSWQRRLFGPTPLQLLDQYLKACGIRYITAKEISRHAWRHTDLILDDASAWSVTFDLFKPGVVYPKGKQWQTWRGVWFALPKYVVPPPEYWPNIIPVLRVVDRFRHWLGKPVRGISGFRHPYYNDMIEGSVTSYHMSMAAIDVQVPSLMQGSCLNTLHVKSWFDKLYRRKGDGFGRYDTFVHIDVGFQRHLVSGKAENWNKQKKCRI